MGIKREYIIGSHQEIGEQDEQGTGGKGIQSHD
jgi:hypothetical protein